jgi:hypothetical protein
MIFKAEKAESESFAGLPLSHEIFPCEQLPEERY